MNCKLVSHWIDHMFELFCAVFGETRAMLWLGKASLAANNPQKFRELCSLFWFVVRSQNS